MDLISTLILQALVTGVVMAVVLWGFHRLILVPYMDRKVAELEAVAERVGRSVEADVNEGLTDMIREIPASSLTGTTRQMMRFGTDLVEGGISSFWGRPESRRER